MGIKPKILGVITARGGSKGIPGKNIKLLLGRPLIAYTVEAAKKSGVFDRIVLSTDDENIAKIARERGCEIPFMRPKELAADTSGHLPVMRHAVSWLKENENYNPDFVMILQPTSPLRQPFHIKEAAKLISDTGADSVISVYEVPETFSPYKAMTVNTEGTLRLFNGDPVRKRTARRQDLPRAFWSVGAIYLFKTSLLFHKEDPNFYGDKVVPYVMEQKYVVDINEPEDWARAEGALQRLTLERQRLTSEA